MLTMERKETDASRKVRLAKEAADCLKRQKVEEALTSEVLSAVEASKGVSPTFVGRVRIHKKCTDECKILSLLGFGEKRPATVLLNDGNNFSMVQIHV